MVDDDDYPWLRELRWHVNSSKENYARTTVGGENILMHRLIMGCGDDLVVDHINRNPLDNRKSNLRVVTKQQNSFNRIGWNKKVSSKFCGVSWRKEARKWVSVIKFNGKQLFLGYFKREIDAATAYNRKAKELFGEFANLNPV